MTWFLCRREKGGDCKQDLRLSIVNILLVNKSLRMILLINKSLRMILFVNKSLGMILLVNKSLRMMRKMMNCGEG